MQRIYLRKTSKEDLEENPKRPYFTLVLPPEKDDETGEDQGEWVTIGALWKAKTGNGYTGTLQEEVNIKVGPRKKTNKDSEEQVDEPRKKKGDNDED
jgi:hypothetical protein